MGISNGKLGTKLYVSEFDCVVLHIRQCLRTPGRRIDFMSIETLLGAPKSTTCSILKKIGQKKFFPYPWSESSVYFCSSLINRLMINSRFCSKHKNYGIYVNLCSHAIKRAC